MEQTDSFTSVNGGPGKIISLCWDAGALGASYYDIDQLELFAIQQAIEPRPQYALLRELVRRYNPLFYVLSGPDCFLDDCTEMLDLPTRTTIGARDNNSSTTSTSIATKVKFYAYNGKSQAYARGRLLSLKVPGMLPESDERECRTFLESMLPFEEELLVHSVGNLLLLLDSASDTVPTERLVTKINLITPSTQLIIDGLTYEALQIFDASRHPSGFKCGTDTRGLSVYSLFNRCSSKNGEEWLSRLMTQPIRDEDELNRRHNTVQWLLENVRFGNQIDLCLKHLSNVGLVYRKILQGTARNGEWKLLKKNLYYLYSLCKMCKLRMGDPATVGTLVENIGQYSRNPDNALKHVLYTVNKCLDLEKGEEENKVIIRAGLNPVVDQLRDQYDGLRRLVMETSRLEMENLQLDMENVCVTYLPSFGFVISTQIDEQLQRSGILNNTTFDLVFQADQTVYFQIKLCKELNTEFGQLIGRMIEQELAIQTRLTNYVGQKFPQIMEVFKQAGKLDALLSFATVAKKYHYVRPIIVSGETKSLKVQAGRHVLLEHQKTYRPNDTNIGEISHRFLIFSLNLITRLFILSLSLSIKLRYTRMCFTSRK